MPKMIEVDEDTWNRYSHIAGLLGKIVQDPKRKAQIERLHKEVDPNAPTPTLDLEKSQAEPIEALRKELDDYKKSVADERSKQQEEATRAALNARFEAGRKSLKDEGWTAEGIEQLEKMMQEKGIIDHADAAKIFMHDHPPQTPAMPGGTGSWNFLESVNEDEGDKFVKKLIETQGKQDYVVDKAAVQALTEFRQQNAQGRR